MVWKSWFPTCLLATSIATILDLGDCREEGFIFPPASSYSDPILSDIKISVNESIIVEYVPLADATYVTVGLQCAGAIENITDLDTNDFEDGPWQYKNTGILWANISSSFYDEYNPNATTNVCMFTLANSTIERCVWGPWGLADFETAYNYSAPPLYYSAVFTVSLVTDGSYHLMVDGNSTRTTKPAASATAHNTTVTCPPSGVPATPITRPTPQIELIPKMAENFTTA